MMAGQLQAGFRRWRVSLAVIGCSWAAVLLVGWLAPTPMVGDEVTHFYMLKGQSECLTAPNFLARIPAAFAEEGYETRGYPHAFLWHYLGAIVYRLGGGSIHLLQFMQSLFWLQALLVLAAILRDRQHADGAEGWLTLVVAASLPMGLIFSVTFYQDVPAAAQVLTAFLMLRRGRWFLSALFMALALNMKENMFLFLPVYSLLFVGWGRGQSVWRRMGAAVLSALVIGGSCAAMAWCVRTYSGSHYYPTRMLRALAGRLFELLPVFTPAGGEGVAPALSSARKVSLYAEGVIANHPGDLRHAVNWILYGGGVLWAVIALAAVGAWWTRFRKPQSPEPGRESSRWLCMTGLSYIALAAYFLRTSPDARFFMPGLLFCLIPLAEAAVRAPYRRWWLPVLMLLAAVQAGTVLHKTYTLRHIPAGVHDAIRYLKDEPPTPNRVFMYPEGNYRLFPCPHNWYLGYRLRDFWRADNDERLRLLRRARIGAIVVKKHLIGKIDAQMNNLGVYPDYFVDAIAADPRFERVLDNEDVTIYRVPPG